MRTIRIVEEICGVLKQKVEFLNSLTKEEYDTFLEDVIYNLEDTVREAEFLKEFPYNSADKN